MPFRSTFDCLWCGTAHTVRGEDDVEGWAQLCPACVGRAGENQFLRFRLRSALDERGKAKAGGASAGTSAGPGAPTALAAGPAPAGVGTDDWYLRRGPHSRGAIDDAAWTADLDEATLWLDGLPWRGEIVELGAGSGWWSPLLATKGELWCYDERPESLEAVRSRLVAHGLRAHLHLRAPRAAPDRQVDGLFIAFPALRFGFDPAELAALGGQWLRRGGLLAWIDLAQATPLEDALSEAGFDDPTVSTTPRYLGLVRAARSE
jgi:hypothetical protein